MQIPTWRPWRRDSAPETGPAHPQLQPLLPAYDAKKHAPYVGMLQDALANPKIRNIALAGQYGSGKSSILAGLDGTPSVEHLDPIFLSLSTIDAHAASKAAGEESSGQGNGIRPITSLIQNEIVKQLLYRERPSKMRNSRFRRTETLRKGSTVAWSIGAAIVILLAVAVYPRAATVYPDSPALLRAGLLSAAALVGTFLVIRFFGSRLSLKEVKAGPATVALDTSRSYFDEYLDELIYFFDVAKHRLVIFEDIDRFDDPHIFETLRELNTLLNSAKQLEDKRGPIRFIYATRDSIFELRNQVPEPMSPGGPTSPAADRTKFFDIVVPVVPFVTHRTSRDMFLERLGPDEIAAPLLGIVSRYVTDMRLITNICNEYLVFKGVILTDDGLRPLRADNLFAMVVYKNLFATDYEAVTRGESKLDKVRKAYRDVVNNTSEALEAKSRDLRAGQRTASDMESFFGAAAERLRPSLHGMIHGLSQARGHLQLASVSVNGQTFELTNLDTESFWECVRLNPDSVVLQTRQGHSMTVPRTALEEAFGAELPDLPIAEALMPMVEAEIHATELARADVLQLRMVDLFERAGLVRNGTPVDFGNLAETTVTSPLVLELLSTGFIDEHFAFYVADYPATTMSAAAAEYEMTVIERHQSDPRLRFPNGDGDVRALIASSGETFLHDRRGYNVQILDALLGDDDLCSSGLAGLISSLATGDREDVAFVDAYLAGGQHQEAFIRRLSGRWSGIFEFLVSAGSTWTADGYLHLSSGRQPDAGGRSVAWLEAAIVGISEEVSYPRTAEVVAALELVADQLTVATCDDMESRFVVEVLTKRFELTYPNIAPFAQVIRSAVVAANAYKVNRANLDTLLASGHRSGDDPLPTPSLDLIRSGFRSYRFPCPAVAGWAESRSA